MCLNLLNIKSLSRFFRFRKTDGYTLLELVVAIPVTIALSTFVAVAIWDAVHTFRLSAASSKVVHDIRFAQQQAMSHNSWYGIEFFIDPVNEYHVYSTNGVMDVDVTDPANRAMTLSINTKTKYDVIINQVNIGGWRKVEFNPMGEPYVDKNGAALALDGSLSLSSGGKTRVIQLLKATGRVDMAWH